MSLFNQILGALNSPNQQGNPEQLSQIWQTVQQCSQTQNVDSGMMQSLLSVVGGQVRSALQRKQAEAGAGQAEAIVNQFGGTTPNSQAVNSLFSQGEQEQVAHNAAQRTGLPMQTILSLLPALVPVILNLLQTGSNHQPAGGNYSTASHHQNLQGGNSVLSAFLDSDRDGDVDIGDAMSLTGRFLNQRR